MSLTVWYLLYLTFLIVMTFLFTRGYFRLIRQTMLRSYDYKLQRGTATVLIYLLSAALALITAWLFLLGVIFLLWIFVPGFGDKP